MNLTDSVNTFLRNLFFGKPAKGEPAYKKEQTFTSTYPKGYIPEYNHWIKTVHEREKKNRNKKEELLKF